ncbi:Dabb family protein [Candidatus Cloacimonadota bacterium]
MIKHIVMWKLHSRAEGFSKLENAARIKDELLKLPSLIEQINSFEVGTNINSSELAFDLVLCSEFRSSIDLVNYQNHPAHIKFKEFINGLRSEIHVVDYEI